MANSRSPDQIPDGASQPAFGPEHHRRRKRKVRRSSRIARKAGFIIALAITWMALWAIWYYLVNRPTPQPLH